MALSESVENKIIAAPFRQKLNFLSYDQKLTFLYTPCQSIFVYSYACMTIIITSIFQMVQRLYLCDICRENSLDDAQGYQPFKTYCSNYLTSFSAYNVSSFFIDFYL